MPEKIKDVKPPSGLSRLAFRLPIWLYRLGMGGLLRDRALLLTHTGRKTGLPRHTVLEVVRYDKEAGEIIISSGFGEKADWCLNIQANPNVKVNVGRTENPALSKRLEKKEAGKELVDYNRRHPVAMKELARFMGYSLDGSEEDVRALGEILPMFSLKLTRESDI